MGGEAIDIHGYVYGRGKDHDFLRIDFSPTEGPRDDRSASGGTDLSGGGAACPNDRQHAAN